MRYMLNINVQKNCLCLAAAQIYRQCWYFWNCHLFQEKYLHLQFKMCHDDLYGIWYESRSWNVYKLQFQRTRVCHSIKDRHATWHYRLIVRTSRLSFLTFLFLAVSLIKNSDNYMGNDPNLFFQISFCQRINPCILIWFQITPLLT